MSFRFKLQYKSGSVMSKLTDWFHRLARDRDNAERRAIIEHMREITMKDIPRDKRWEKQPHRADGEITEIVIHCTASGFGDAETIDRWHKLRGWAGIGYHDVIMNGHRTPGAPYAIDLDGAIEHGRPYDVQGAHCHGHNHNTIGVCLIGNPTDISTPDKWFTKRQMAALKALIMGYIANFPIKQIRGHNHYAVDKDGVPYKSCPGFMVQSDNHNFGRWILKQISDLNGLDIANNGETTDAQGME